MSTPRPRDGYGSNPAKQRWRHVAFQFADRTAFCRRKAARLVACLESAEGREVRHALSLGYDPAKIHAFNWTKNSRGKSKAILANMTRALDRDGLPRVRTYARTIAEAAEVLPEPADILSLDFCGPITDRQIAEIHRAATMLRPGGVVMVNVLGARTETLDFARHTRATRPVLLRSEWRQRRAVVRDFAAADVERVGGIVAALCAARIEKGRLYGCRWVPINRWMGRYMSDRQPFVWTVLTLSPCDGHTAFDLGIDGATKHAHAGGRRPIEVYAESLLLRFPFICNCELLALRVLRERLQLAAPATAAEAFVVDDDERAPE